MRPAHPETWFLWQDCPRASAMNMAIDEALLLTAPQRQDPVLRFYAWEAANAVTIGYVQKATAAPPDCEFVRRPTGGGVVHHDHDFTYSVAVPSGHWLTGLDRTESYDWINRSVQSGLRTLRLPANLADQEISEHVDRATMVCFTNPTKYDLLLDGRKIAGSAQRRTRDGILHQGSLHFGGPLPAPREQLATAIVAGLEETLNLTFAAFEPDHTLLDVASDLAQTKYATDGWNRKR